ncbi:integrase core domain-containing protein [Nesterenkonia massiliensis]|uniref:Integrase core domain-containing protein n=1 Tax=Nesterenkonia massiliensis TaxID=1232429 RepID=A0ABT2HQM5_9MICC|nr:integrase core domain-containing protein [Nesterenkonia massiliensis]MCT1606962.1 integrase core domain-containing protein [Nesterenkonia massiliensis]
MPTSRFVKLTGVPERSYRRWQAKAKQAQPPKGPWPQPVRVASREIVTKHALAHPAWGHRKIWAMTRHDGRRVSQATVLRILRDEGLILPAEYQKQRRELAKDRKAAFAQNPTGPNQVWQLDFSEFETTTGGAWRIAGCRDWYSKFEHRFHTSPTANQHDAIAAIELALEDYKAMFGHPLIDACDLDPDTGELLPAVTIVTDNGGPFRSLNFELFITSHPELRHVRTRVKSPGQNGSRERGFGTLKYERLFLDEIPDALALIERAEDYRAEYNTIRPHEAIAFNRPQEVHLGLADPTIPTFEREKILPKT